MSGWRKLATGFGFLVALAGAGCDKSPEFRAPVVPQGRIGYNEGPIRTHGLYSCSAVILDYQEKVLLAHATSGTDRDSSGRPGVRVGNVVDKMVLEAKKRGFDLENSFAIINAGGKESLELIKRDFRDYGIKVRGANTELSPRTGYHPLRSFPRQRTVFYDPKSNLTSVHLD